MTDYTENKQAWELNQASSPDSTFRLVGQASATDEVQYATTKQVLAIDQRGVRVKFASNLSVADDTWTSPSWDTESFDRGSHHDTSTNPERITPATAGGWLIGGTVFWAANATGQRGIELRINGSTIISQDYNDASAASNTGMSVSPQLYEFNGTTDYVELRVYQNSTGALNLLAGERTNFWAVLQYRT